MLTDIPGSSRYFQRGWITYANKAKTEMLGVSSDLLAKDGAVSESVVRAMARSAREMSHADFSLAISGVAGPGGGTPAKPVGTVCIAVADAGGIVARTFNFPGDREAVRDRSAKMALTMLRFRLLGRPAPFSASLCRA
jgi:PncC family amidohydrolase